MKLNQKQIIRYKRQIDLPEIGEKGQEKLLKARVLIIGTGGLGSPCSLYLAAAGIGTLGIVDSDKVELGNLQRQILHSEDYIDLPKVKSAKDRLSKLNADIKVIPYNIRINKTNIIGILDEYDIVVDCSDNFQTRYLINDACILYGKPLFYGAINQFFGQVTTIFPRESACLRCLFLESSSLNEKLSDQQLGVLGVVPGMIGIIQASEVIKYVLGAGRLLNEKLLIIDILELKFEKLNTHRNNHCIVCGDNPIIKELKDYDQILY